MDILFMSLVPINSLKEKGIYHDLLNVFRDDGHQIYILYPWC